MEQFIVGRFWGWLDCGINNILVLLITFYFFVLQKNETKNGTFRKSEQGCLKICPKSF